MGLLKDSLEGIVNGITNPFSVYVSATMLDASSTYQIIKEWGVYAESNPITRYIVQECGNMDGMIIKTASEILAGIGAYYMTKLFRKQVNWSFSLENAMLYYLAAWQAAGGIPNTLELYYQGEYWAEQVMKHI